MYLLATLSVERCVLSLLCTGDHSVRRLWFPKEMMRGPKTLTALRNIQQIPGRPDDGRMASHLVLYYLALGWFKMGSITM